MPSGRRTNDERRRRALSSLEPIPKPLTDCERVGTSSAASFGRNDCRTKGDDDVPESVSARITAPAAADVVGDPRPNVELDPILIPCRETAGNPRPPGGTLSHRLEWHPVRVADRLPMESRAEHLWLRLYLTSPLPGMGTGRDHPRHPSATPAALRPQLRN